MFPIKTSCSNDERSEAMESMVCQQKQRQQSYFSE